MCQVRFTILEDCLPLAEEKFRKVIKDNYFTKNKFDCQLKQEQVFKLFSSIYTLYYFRNMNRVMVQDFYGVIKAKSFCGIMMPNLEGNRR